MVVKHLGLRFKSCLCYCVTLDKFLNLSEPFSPFLFKMGMFVYNSLIIYSL